MQLATAELVNEIAADPKVREMMFLGMRYPDNDLDFSGALEDSKNVALEEGGFCAVFMWSAPGVYECHIMARKEARGVESMRIGRAMLAYMKELGAKMIWGQPSVYNKAAICYIRRMGLSPAGFGSHGILGDVQYFVKEGL